jgi:hypothetical protein
MQNIHQFIFFFFFSYSLSFCMQPTLFIQTTDNKIRHINIKKDLPGGGTLKYLLRTYAQQFKKYNSEKSPLKINVSSQKLDYFSQALCIIAFDNNRFICKNEDFYFLLLKLALQFQSLKLYIILITSQNFREYNRLLDVPELNNKIAITWMELDHNYVWGKPYKHFFHGLLQQTIRFNAKQTVFTPFLAQTNDGKYGIRQDDTEMGRILYVYHTENITPCIKTFPRFRQFTLLKQRNLILLAQLDNRPQLAEGLYLYDIQNDNLHLLLPYYSIRIHKAISPNEQYIAATHNHYVMLWNIKDLQNITKGEYAHQESTTVAFSADSTLLASGPAFFYAELRLWRIVEDKLELQNTFNQCIPGNLLFMNNDQYLLIQSFNIQNPQLQNLKIEKKDNKFSFSPCLRISNVKAFNTDYYDQLCGIASSNFLIYHDVTYCWPAICSSSGNILFTDVTIHASQIAVSNNKKHIVIADHARDKLHIFHLGYDKDNNLQVIEYHATNTDVKNNPHCNEIMFHKESALLLEDIGDTLLLKNLHGELVRKYSKDPEYYSPFHPTQNAICFAGTLYELYDEETKKTIKSKMQTLTITQYALMKKICSKETPIKLKCNSFYGKIFRACDDEMKKLCQDKLKLTLKVENPNETHI